MKKDINRKGDTNAKVGRTWSAEGIERNNDQLPNNFIMGMTNQSMEFNPDQQKFIAASNDK